MNCSFAGMNYLAHAYLSFNHPGILVGNMVSDFVKGAAKFSFNGIIQQGINLHRDIDSFTDTHPATREAKSVFQPAYRLYSGAIMDVLYDHFLANDPEHFDPSHCACSLQKPISSWKTMRSTFLRVFSRYLPI